MKIAQPHLAYPNGEPRWRGLSYSFQHSYGLHKLLKHRGRILAEGFCGLPCANTALRMEIRHGL